MIELNMYENNLSKAYDYLEFTAENNGFYTPTRQEVCKAIYDKKDRTVNKMELAIKYLQRRFKEQGLEVFLENQICKKVFQSQEWKKRWPDESVVILANGKKLNEKTDETC